jgi:hypothetical protein
MPITGQCRDLTSSPNNITVLVDGGEAPESHTFHKIAMYSATQVSSFNPFFCHFLSTNASFIENVGVIDDIAGHEAAANVLGTSSPCPPPATKFHLPANLSLEVVATLLLASMTAALALC